MAVVWSYLSHRRAERPRPEVRPELVHRPGLEPGPVRVHARPELREARAHLRPKAHVWHHRPLGGYFWAHLRRHVWVNPVHTYTWREVRMHVRPHAQPDVRTHVWSHVRPVIRAHVWSNIRSHVWWNIWSHVWPNIWTHIRSYIRPHIRSYIRPQVRLDVRTHFWP